MIYANPIIMFEVHCPRCKIQIIIYREDLDQPVRCEECSKKFQVSLPTEEIGEVIFDRTG